MDEISLDDLLGQLQSVQEENSKVRLSERNVVELISKLQAADLLGPDLLHTINGREYVTEEHLRGEVQGAVDSSGGRIPVVDLPALLGLDLVHCERQAAAAVAQSGGALQLVQGELITTKYFDALAGEVADSLQEAGALQVGEVAARTRLGVELLRPVLAARMGTTIPGHLEGGLLYTDAHIARIRARVRGALRGALTPVGVPGLGKALQLKAGAAVGFSLGSIIEELAASGELDNKLPAPPSAFPVVSIAEELAASYMLRGSLKGGGSTWVPDVHAQAQQQSVLNFFRQNRVIEYSAAAKMGIAQPQAHLQAAFPDGIALQHTFVGAELVAQLDSAAEDALASGSWVDVAPLLPGALSSEDAAELLGHCPAVQGATASSGHAKAAAANGSGDAFASGTCVVSGALVAELADKLAEEARAAAEEQLRQRKASAAAAAAPQQSSGKGFLRKGAPSTATASLPVAAAGSDSDEDWGRKGGKGKGSKGKAGGKGKRGGGKVPAPAKATPPGGKGGGKKADDAASIASRALSAGAITAKILQWQPAMEDSGHVAKELAQRLRPAALAEFERALSAVFAAGADARRRACEAASVALQAAFTRLQMLAHGIEAVAGDDAELAMLLQRHLLRGAGAEAIDALLRFHELDLQQDADASPDAAAAAQPAPLAPAERSKLLQRLPPDVGPPAAAAVACASGTDAEALVDAIEEAAGAGGSRLRRLDKKAERREVHSHQKALMEALEAEDTPPAALSLAVPLLAIKVWGRAISLPGRALAPVIERLAAAGLAEADHEALVKIHAGVVTSLASSSGNGDANVDLQAVLPELKRIAGVSSSTAAPDPPGADSAAVLTAPDSEAATAKSAADTEE